MRQAPVEHPLGPVMLDVAGAEITAAERERLLHPLVGGVILFARNYVAPAQLAHLTLTIHELRAPPLLIAVDHEGGRVQRFRDGFTVLPPMRALGRLAEGDTPRACRAAQAIGYVLGTELRACGVDLSFTPVLDLDYGASSVIGDRAFHADPLLVAELGGALITGLTQARMSAVGKHFPGHGFVSADSHTDLPIDGRDFAALAAADLVPFRELAGRLGGIMPAHVVYDKVDARPAGFSRLWLQQILRRDIGFAGVIFSDDLSMEGASEAGGIVARADAALAAGCDMVLVCNDPDAAGLLLAEWKPRRDEASARRIRRLLPRGEAASAAALNAQQHYLQARELAAAVSAVA